MPFKISGHDSVRSLSTRREAAIDAIARAAKMMRQGFQDVRITDMTTGRTYNSDKFHLIVRRASGTAAIWHPGPTLHPSKLAGENRPPSELFDLSEIREELLRLGVRTSDRPAKLATSVRSEQTATVPALMTAAYELAGYAVATLALGRSIPEKVTLKKDNDYDLGRCTEPELDIIWAVGHMAGERSRNYGCSGEQGLIVINVRVESSIADVRKLYPGVEVILNENWDRIVRVARLLIERGILSRSELEGKVFEPDEGRGFEHLHSQNDRCE
jgi:hypothetical protein